jgi:hypothetical protein
MKPKKLHGAAAANKYNRMPESYQDKALRNVLWAGIGMTPDQLGERLRLALDRATDLLEATETRFFSHEGKVTDQRLIKAHKAQLKAIHEITNIVRMLLPKQDAIRQGPVNVNVTVPWTRQPER